MTDTNTTPSVKVSDEAVEAQSTTAFRLMIAREIWAYQECPWDFDNPPDGMAQLQKRIAIDEAERIRSKLFGPELFRASLLLNQVIEFGRSLAALAQYLSANEMTQL